MKQTLKDLKVISMNIFPFFCDNTSAINILRRQFFIHILSIYQEYHFLRERVADHELKLEYVINKDQMADIFNKPLPKETFETLHQKLRVVASPA